MYRPAAGHGESRRASPSGRVRGGATGEARTVRAPWRTARVERQAPDVAPNQTVPRSRRFSDAPKRAWLAPLSIGPSDRCPRAARLRARAATQSDQCRSRAPAPAAAVERKIPPERDVALAERPRILPVVERRVVVPAFVALLGDGRPVALTGFDTSTSRPSVRRWRKASCAESRRTTSPLAAPLPRRW